MKELKDILRSKGLSSAGNKAELVLRIEEANPDKSWVTCYSESNNPLLQ